jgi:hypothetical protein
MANTVTNIVQIFANDEAIDKINERFEVAGGYSDMVKFAKAFYDEPEIIEGKDGEKGGLSIKWSLDFMGAKWVYIENDIDMDRWNIASANYYPHDFLKHLFDLVNEVDPEAYIVNKFQDESYYPVGVVVYKKDYYGDPMWYSVEENMDDPTNDMDWDDEGYDDAREEFTYSVENFHDEQVEHCIKMIENGDGRTFDE